MCMLSLVLAVALFVIAPSQAMSQTPSERFTALIKTTELPDKIRQRVADAGISSCPPQVSVKRFQARKAGGNKFSVIGAVDLKICSFWFDDEQVMRLKGLADSVSCKLNVSEVSFSDWALNTANAVLSAVDDAKEEPHDISDDAQGGRCDHYFLEEYLETQ